MEAGNLDATVVFPLSNVSSAEAGVISSFFQLAATKCVSKEVNESLFNPRTLGIGRF